ncbi:unnamed protein product [Colias eurytheme]|nr:unnamed protein product [Colias eurytheme]
MAPCSIKWCGKTSKTSSLQKDGITFHMYPQDPDIKKEWIDATRRDDWFPSKYSVICSRRFTPDCFLNTKSRRRLLGSAVPTLFLPLLSNEENPNEEKPSTSEMKRNLVPLKGQLLQQKGRAFLEARRFMLHP